MLEKAYFDFVAFILFESIKVGIELKSVSKQCQPHSHLIKFVHSQRYKKITISGSIPVLPLKSLQTGT